MNERSFKGIWIPKEIWLTDNLNITEKCFLVEIDSLDNDLGCFASNQYFADFFKLSKNRCSEIIKGLEDKSYIKINYIFKDNSKEVEKRVIRCIRKIDRPIREIEGGYSENTEDSNTLLNNPINNKTLIAEIENFFEECWKLYPSKVGIGRVTIKAKNNSYKIGEEFKRCIQRYVAYVENRRKTDFKELKYQNGSTFWNSGYLDFLDKNYQEEVKKPEEVKTYRVKRGAI